MLPFEPDDLPDLDGVSVFIGAGEHDPMAPRATVERLETVLEDAGADVTTHWTPGGHAITKEELAAAQEWMVGVAVG
jgi:phospholipase/carboxylesterase